MVLQDEIKGISINKKSQYYNVIYSLYGGYFCKEKLLLEWLDLILLVCISLLLVFQSHTRPKILYLISVTLCHINGIIKVHFKSYLNQCFYVSQLLKNDGNIVVKYGFSMVLIKVRNELKRSKTTYNHLKRAKTI